MNKPARVGGVIVSHGRLADELLSASEEVVGDLAHIAAVSIGWHDDLEIANEAIGRAIEKVSTGKGVLLLTDMFGGTPTNIAATFLKDGEVDIVTGVNLPMVIRLASAGDNVTLEQIAREVEEQGKESIYRGGVLLNPHGIKKNA